MLGGNVWIWIKSNLFRLIEGQTHFSISWHAKMSFGSEWSDIACFLFAPPHYLQACIPNLTEYRRYCMLTPNPWSNSHVELEDNPKVSSLIRLWVTCLKWTRIFEWCVGKCGSKNGHQKDIFWKGIGIWSQNLSTIIGSIINIIWGVCVFIKWERESSLLFDLNMHTALNIIRKVVAGTIWIC